jgi:hypothetical protein
MLEFIKKVKYDVTKFLRDYFAFLKTNRCTKVIFYVSVAVPFILTCVLFVVLPLLNPIKLTEKEFGPPSYIAPQLNELKIDEMYMQSQLKLAKFDSINLAIDLRDSLAILQIRGVRIRECKLHSVQINSAINQLSRSGTIHAWLSTPFISQSDWSTIPKAPIKVKRAPKDTTEANQQADTAKVIIERPDVFVTIEYDKGLVLEIGQIQWPTFIGGIKKFFYRMRLKIEEIRNTLSAILRRQLPDHSIRIKIELSQNDVKAIYRALPRKSGLALRIKV